MSAARMVSRPEREAGRIAWNRAYSSPAIPLGRDALLSEILQLLDHGRPKALLAGRRSGAILDMITSGGPARAGTAR